MSEPRDPDLSRRKLRDAAMVLPFVGVFLLMPPFIRVFLTSGTIAGIPAIVVYIFAVWLALIVCAWRLAGPLNEAGALDARPGGDGTAPDS